MKRFDFPNIETTNPDAIEIAVEATVNVKKTPTVPTYINSTTHLGSLYLFFLSPSIWNGTQMDAANAARILERVVYILKVPIPGSEVPSSKNFITFSVNATIVKTITMEQRMRPTIHLILLIVLALVITFFFDISFILSYLLK